MSRRCKSAQRSWIAVGATLAIGLAFGGPAPANAASGSPPPKPQVLWRAYPLDSAQTNGARKIHGVGPGVAPTKPTSAPASDHQADGTLSTGRLAALGALAAGVVGVLVLLGRRRGAARRRPESEPASGDSPSRRRVLNVLGQDDGSLARARRGERRHAAPPGSSSSAAAEDVAEKLTESVLLISRPHVVYTERVARRPEPRRDQPRSSAAEKAALKRTSEAADAEAAAKLKEKGHASAALKDARQRDLTALKAKLGHPPTSPDEPYADAKRTHAANGAPPPGGATVRPIVQSGVEEPSPQTEATTPTRCRIEWRPSGDESVFCALGQTPTGDEPALLTSPPFAWTGDAPPSKDLPQVGSAYRALESKLVAEGWVATGIGGRWYELELERTAEHIRTTN